MLLKSEADDEGRKVGEKVYSTASNAHDNSIYKFEQNYDSKNRLTKQSLTTELTSGPGYLYLHRERNCRDVLNRCKVRQRTHYHNEL